MRLQIRYKVHMACLWT